MNKPEEFRHTCIVKHDVEYRVEESDPKGPYAAQGVLHVGRVVWLKSQPAEILAGAVVTCFAEGIGLIEINSSVLGKS
jgi:hypothetical protein